MRFRVYNDPTEPEVILRLVTSDGDVTLAVVDRNGEPKFCGNILTIKSDGSAILHPGVTENLGLQLDSDGRVIFA